MHPSNPDTVLKSAEALAPVIWLLGKAQAGKTSVVAELTGAARGEIGNGFQATTRKARVYAFPPELPVVRFLDTRGLEEGAAYDPGEDMAFAEQQTHLLLAVVRAEDQVLDSLYGTLRAVRRRHPDWPVLILQTRVHDLYPRGADHPDPYPYSGTEEDLNRADLPEPLRRALRAQRKTFSDLPGAAARFVVVDFTAPEAGFTPVNFGAEALWDALEAVLPEVHARLFRGGDPGEAARRQVILPWSLAAAAADAVPLPIVGGLASSGVQARMVVLIAERFGLRSDREIWLRFIRLLGGAFALRYAAKFLIRQALKLIPGAGSAAVAVWSFGVTYALGEAAVYFCREVSKGREPDRETLRRTYAEQLAKAREVWAERSKREGGI